MTPCDCTGTMSTFLATPVTCHGVPSSISFLMHACAAAIFAFSRFHRETPGVTRFVLFQTNPGCCKHTEQATQQRVAMHCQHRLRRRRTKSPSRATTRRMHVVCSLFPTGLQETRFQAMPK